MDFAGLLLALALGSVHRQGVMPGLGRRPEGDYQSPATLPATSSQGGDASPAFDARTAFPGCVHRVLDQGSCGSCWAFAATEALSDRFCIRSLGAVNVTLSPGDLLSCEKLNLGCTVGSLPEWAWCGNFDIAELVVILDHLGAHRIISRIHRPCAVDCATADWGVVCA